jgi:hypothetical protein
MVPVRDARVGQYADFSFRRTWRANVIGRFLDDDDLLKLLGSHPRSPAGSSWRPDANSEPSVRPVYLSGAKCRRVSWVTCSRLAPATVPTAAVHPKSAPTAEPPAPSIVTAVPVVGRAIIAAAAGAHPDPIPPAGATVAAVPVVATTAAPMVVPVSASHGVAPATSVKAADHSTVHSTTAVPAATAAHGRCTQRRAANGNRRGG